MSIFEASLLFLLCCGAWENLRQDFSGKALHVFPKRLAGFPVELLLRDWAAAHGFPIAASAFFRCAAGKNRGLALFFKKMYPKVVESSKRRVHLASLGRLVLA